MCIPTISSFRFAFPSNFTFTCGRSVVRTAFAALGRFSLLLTQFIAVKREQCVRLHGQVDRTARKWMPMLIFIRTILCACVWTCKRVDVYVSTVAYVYVCGFIWHSPVSHTHTHTHTNIRHILFKTNSCSHSTHSIHNSHIYLRCVPLSSSYFSMLWNEWSDSCNATMFCLTFFISIYFDTFLFRGHWRYNIQFIGSCYVLQLDNINMTMFFVYFD